MVGNEKSNEEVDKVSVAEEEESKSSGKELGHIPMVKIRKQSHVLEIQNILLSSSQWEMDLAKRWEMVTADLW